MEESAFRAQAPIGHERVLRTLGYSVQRGTVHHAYLFEGMPGIGKKEIAAWFSRAMLCESCRPADGLDFGEGAELACGICNACSSLQRGQHPDLLELSAPEGSKQIRVEQIRELIQRTRYAPLRGRRRVILLHQADRMGEVAANALLKTLEEPATYNTFVLLTDRAQSLLPTILSRCQRVRFAPLSRARVVDALKGDGVPASEAHVLAAASGGSLGMARQLNEAGFLENSLKWLERYLSPGGAAAADPRDAIADAATIGQAFRKNSDPYTSDFAVLRTSMILGLRDVILHNSGAEKSLMTWPQRADITARLSEKVPLPRLVRLMERLQDAEQLFTRPLNPTLVVEDTLLKLVTGVRV